MNPLIDNLIDRLKRNDLLLTQVSTTTFPFSDHVSYKETTALLSALVDNEIVETVAMGEIPRDAPMIELLETNKAITSLTIGGMEESWETLARGLCRNDNVETLVLGNHNSVALVDVSEAECKSLGELLRTTHAQKVTLQNFGFESTEQICDGLSDNQSIRELTIRQCESNALDCLSALLDALPTTRVEKVLLFDLDIEDVCFEPLRDVSLVELCVNDCLLEPDSLEFLCEWIQDHATLRLLDLSRNELIPASASCIAELLSCNCALEEIRLDENHLGNNGCKTILSALPDNRCLKLLRLRSVGITGASLELEEEGYVHLYELDLSENIEFGSNGAAKLSRALYKFTNLQRLNLDACMIDDEGVETLSHAIPPTLVELNLSNNVVGLKGGTALAQNIGSLRTLDLSSCNVSDDVLQCFLHHLLEQECNELNNLYLSFNEITDTEARRIASALQNSNCRLETLSIQFNEFHDAGLSVIVEALRRNTSLHQLFPWNQSITHAHLGTMDHWLELNRAGRSRILENNIPAHWPVILAKADQHYTVNALFYAFCERPELVSGFTPRWK